MTRIGFPLGPRGLSELFRHLAALGYRVRKDYRCVAHTADKATVEFKDEQAAAFALLGWPPTNPDERTL